MISMNKRAMIRLCKLGACALVLMLTAWMAWPAKASACACCAEPGVWYERTAPIDSYELSEINRLKFDALATTYMDAGGEDSIEGVSNVADAYTLSLSKGRGRWLLNFKDKAGRTGTLALTVPNALTNFGADIHDSPEGGETMLYKEWRLTGAVTGTGVFKKGSTPRTRYRLVFQGRGNNCTSAETFSNWTLQVFGPGASYSFYGKFKDPAPAKS
jgi:hypothetical protein